ncbi:MAG: FYDLN acid domain-containing protein [Rhodobacteraceae bacterium]|nr:FYDLN acid domain-containing protein [Paracoccaceae bacterium]
MPKDEWGVKRVCPKCAVRFYDLRNDPMTCPSCGATFDVESLTTSRSRSATVDKEPKVQKPKVVADDLDEAAIDLDDDSNADDLDDELLDDDDDDAVSFDDIADVATEDDES